MKYVLKTLPWLAATMFFGTLYLVPSQPIAVTQQIEQVDQSPAEVSPKETQQILMQRAYEIALADGHKDPTVLQQVILQESEGGTAKTYRVVNHGNGWYFGPAQVSLSAAREVLQRWPQLFDKYDFHTRTDDEIKANLILNEPFNLEIASKYLKWLSDKFNFKGTMLLNAYNQGPGGVKNVGPNFYYAREARAKLTRYQQDGK